MAIGVVEASKQARKTRFVKTSGAELSFDEERYKRAENLVGLKGYVTIITAEVTPANEVISCHHDRWHVEQSFRMSKHDLAACPIYHHTRDANRGPLDDRVHRLCVMGCSEVRYRISPDAPPSTPSSIAPTIASIRNSSTNELSACAIAVIHYQDLRFPARRLARIAFQ